MQVTDHVSAGRSLNTSMETCSNKRTSSFSYWTLSQNQNSLVVMVTASIVPWPNRTQSPLHIHILKFLPETHCRIKLKEKKFVLLFLRVILRNAWTDFDESFISQFYFETSCMWHFYLRQVVSTIWYVYIINLMNKDLDSAI